MKQQGAPDTLFATAKRNWRYFVGIWTFPAFFFIAWPLLPGVRDYAMQYFFLLVTPVFFACNWIAQKPMRDGVVTKFETVVLAVVVPLVIWCATVFGFWGLYFLIRLLGPQVAE